MNEHPNRDLIGYRSRPPHKKWPNDARLAVDFALRITHLQ